MERARGIEKDKGDNFAAIYFLISILKDSSK